jgi:hypothetical protein
MGILIDSTPTIMTFQNGNHDFRRDDNRFDGHHIDSCLRLRAQPPPRRWPRLRVCVETLMKPNLWILQQWTKRETAFRVHRLQHTNVVSRILAQIRQNHILQPGNFGTATTAIMSTCLHLTSPCSTTAAERIRCLVTPQPCLSYRTGRFC